MKFDQPATTNPLDRLNVIGHPIDRIDGPLKTTGTAPYALDRQDVVAGQAHGYVVGSGIATGRIVSMDLAAAEAAPGVIAIVTADNAGELERGNRNTAMLLGGPRIQHYHQAIALIVAETFEQARDAAHLLRVEYSSAKGAFDLQAAKDSAPVAERLTSGDSPETQVGNFTGAYDEALVQLDATYTTADESHSMMEPHATIAAWDGDELTLWTSNQMIAWTVDDMARTLRMPKEKIRVISPYVGGGFGAKLFLRADIVLAALGARAAGRPVKVSLPRALIPNNTVHRAATIQRIRIGATEDGKIAAIGHESWSGDLPDGNPEAAAVQTRSLYAGRHRMTSTRLAVLDLPEASAMRAPGEAPGMAALEIAMDEMAEKLGMDPIEFRVVNDTQVVPGYSPEPESDDPQSLAADGQAERATPFSQRQLAECFRVGADRFGWDQRNPVPGPRSTARRALAGRYGYCFGVPRQSAHEIGGEGAP